MKSKKKCAATLVIIAAVIGFMGCKPVVNDNNAVIKTVATPKFNVEPGEVKRGTSVSISCATEGAVIFYTINGETPTIESKIYKSSINIKRAVTINAIAVKSGMNNSEVASISYTIPARQDSTGLLEGAGIVEKENIDIEGTIYQKTGEVVIVPKGKVAVIDMKDDSAWDTYVVDSAEPEWKGVFTKDCKVTLSPFVMSQYEVTQELYEAVLSSDKYCNATPSIFSSDPAENEKQCLRPVECVNWYDAVYFCNALTKLTMNEDDCVYTITDIIRSEFDGSIDSATVEQNLTKKGYRLPTEAEWEYAARGGNPQADEWMNAFCKVNTEDGAMIYNGQTYLEKDDNLATVGWYYGNSNMMTHEVGLKDKNSLNLYDMIGNVCEWCWDDVPDESYSGWLPPDRVYRSSCYSANAYYCAVSIRNKCSPHLAEHIWGFRVCRSISD